MPTLIELPEIEACANLCNELNMQFIELNMNLPQYQIGAINAAVFNIIAQKYEIYYTMHLDENFNISDFNPFVAEAYMHTIKETIELAKQLEIPVLNMHLLRGVYFTLPEKKVFLFDEYKEYYLQSITCFRDECEKAVGKYNIKICIENSDGYTDIQAQALNILLKSYVFALTFDIGHNHSIGGSDEPIIMSHKDKLYHFHFHDAAGSKNHLALGMGELDLHKYYCLAEQNSCRIVLETKTVAGLKQSVRVFLKTKYAQKAAKKQN